MCKNLFQTQTQEDASEVVAPTPATTPRRAEPRTRGETALRAAQEEYAAAERAREDEIRRAAAAQAAEEQAASGSGVPATSSSPQVVSSSAASTPSRPRRIRKKPDALADYEDDLPDLVQRPRTRSIVGSSPSSKEVKKDVKKGKKDVRKPQHYKDPPAKKVVTFGHLMKKKRAPTDDEIRAAILKANAAYTEGDEWKAREIATAEEIQQEAAELAAAYNAETDVEGEDTDEWKDWSENEDDLGRL